MPCRWDFPHVKDEDFKLPEVKVERWGGFVFINMDPDAGPSGRPSRRAAGPLQGRLGPLQPLHRAAHPEGAGHQLEGGAGGLPRGLSCPGHPYPGAADRRRRQCAVRHLQRHSDAGSSTRSATPARTTPARRRSRRSSTSCARLDRGRDRTGRPPRAFGRCRTLREELGRGAGASTCPAIPTAR